MPGPWFLLACCWPLRPLGSRPPISASAPTPTCYSRPTLPWRQRAVELNREFPQFRDLLVAVVDARIPEEADATAGELAARLSADKTHFLTVRRPDANPFLEKEGLLFLQLKQLSALMDQTIDAQPFLGQLVADPSARGLFSALSLLGIGVTQGDADLSPYLSSIKGFHQAMADALDGHPKPLSWETLLGGGLAELAGPYHFVLVQPHQDFGALEPGGAATQAMRDIIAGLPFVQSGDAHVRITGQVALADEEFASVAEGAVEGPDRQPGADHAMAVPGGALVAADTADPDDAGAGPDADGAFRGRRGRHAQSGVGRVRGAVRRYSGRFRHPVFGALPRVPFRDRRSRRRDD